MSSLYPPSEETVGVRKSPSILALASVTYGAVIAVTIISILAYYFLVPKRTDAQFGDQVRSVSVGSVWIPVYPGGKVAGNSSTKRGIVTESILDFETSDPPDRVLSYYEAALKKGIFRFDTVSKIENGGTVRTVVHEGKTTVLVTVLGSGEGSRGKVRTIDSDGRK